VSEVREELPGNSRTMRIWGCSCRVLANGSASRKIQNRDPTGAAGTMLERFYRGQPIRDGTRNRVSISGETVWFRSARLRIA